MASFEFVDCPSSLTLTASDRGAKPAQIHDVMFSLRNRTARSISARTSVQPAADTRSEWFSIDGAPPTTPCLRDLDLEPNTTTGVMVRIMVPPDASAGKHLFRVRVAAEDDPDDDFADSPAVTFATPEPPQATPARRVPWWLLAVVGGILAMALAGVATWWVVHHRGPHDTRGELGDDATRQLTSAGYIVTSVTGAGAGKPRNTVIDQVNDPDGKHVKLVLDPGTPKDVRGELLDQARKDLDGYAIETTYKTPTGKSRDTVTEQVNDAGGKQVKLGLDPGTPKDVRAELIEQARKDLAVYRIETNYASRSTGKPRDTVIDQSYESGVVRLSLDPGPPRDVRGKPLDQARKDLGSYSVETKYGLATGKPRDIVTDQNYDSGSNRVTLALDPGPPPKAFRGETVEQASADLTGYNVEKKYDNYQGLQRNTVLRYDYDPTKNSVVLWLDPGPPPPRSHW